MKKIIKITKQCLASLSFLTVALFLAALTISFGSLIFSPIEVVNKGAYTNFKHISKEEIRIDIGGKTYVFNIDNIEQDAYLALVNKENVELQVHDMKWRIEFISKYIMSSSQTLTKVDSEPSMASMRFACVIIALFFGFFACEIGYILYLYIRNISFKSEY